MSSKRLDRTMSRRERVVRALNLECPDRVPRDVSWDPAVQVFQRKELEDLLRRIPMDIGTPEFKRGISDRQKGHPIVTAGTPGWQKTVTKKGQKWIDEWGSVRYVGEDGLFGVVNEPVLDDLSGINEFSAPWECLKSTDLSEVNRNCAESDKFMISDICARPFERLQFLRGTEKFFVDLAYARKELFQLRDMVHEYNLEHIRIWLKTDVDGIFMMDDWGTQSGLLISPSTWREFLRPLYEEYCNLVHKHGKYVFFHSDGDIEEIFEDVIEVGIDAINAQLFCMDIERLAEKFKGRITFWGEIDGQRLLPFGGVDQVTEAVYRVRLALDDRRGGVIAQCNWGKNNPSNNIQAVFDAWNKPLKELATRP